MNTLDQRKSSEIIHSLSSREYLQWSATRRRYASSVAKPQKDDYWSEFCRKMKTLAENFPIAVEGEGNKPLIICRLVLMIWPRENETDTAFGTKEIDALLQFKYFLTEDAQELLLDELETFQKS